MTSFKLNSKSAREKLKPRHPQYWSEIDRGVHLGYRKSASSGTWYVRRYTGGKYIVKRIGLTDDNQPANGITVLSHKQARRRATDYEDVLETFVQPLHPALFTVADAINDYLEWYRANKKAYERTKGICSAHILPKLGNVPVARLTTPQINKWVQTLATTPPRTPKGNPKPPYAEKVPTGELNRVGNPKFEYRQFPFEQWTDTMQRKRKSTANRVLTVLKAALNHAWRNDKVEDPGAWQKVKSFHGADSPKVRYLTEAEASKLLETASDDFRPMARAALLTGCRYGELCRLQVSDFADGQIFIEKEKSDKPRHVPLSDHGIKFFKALAKDKSRNDLLLTHQDGSNWDRSHQTRPMRQACEKAGINPPVGFHVLRHTYATLLLRSDGSQGVSIRYVAALIGDSVATCEKHYGHVIQDDLRKEVARKLPSFGDT
ncbi:MAG: site-specific integrase [Proteobacteria bacterium]|nr:site-specific integrase [Pseudomonadota bacterium]